MKGKRKFSPEFKAKVALEAIKGQKTLNELSKEYELTPKQISEWKKEFLAKAALLFTKESPDLSKEIHELHARIGQLDMMVDFLKKVVTEHTSVGERKRMVEPDHSGLSVLQRSTRICCAASSLKSSNIKNEEELSKERGTLNCFECFFSYFCGCVLFIEFCCL